MRENEPVLLVLSACDRKLFLRMVKFYLRNDNGERAWSRVESCRLKL